MIENTKKTRLDTKDPVRRILISIVMIICSALIGLLAMMAAYLLPVDMITRHVTWALPILEQGNDYPVLNESYISSELDMYTDSQIMAMAIYNGKESILEKAFFVPYEDPQEYALLTDKLAAILRDDISAPIYIYISTILARISDLC